MPLLRVCGIRIELHFTFVALALFVIFSAWHDGGWFSVGLTGGLLGFVFLSVVLHELGHSLTARRYGVEVNRILLLPIGGVAQFSVMPRNPREELMITLAGPAVNLAIVILLLPFMFPLWPPPTERGMMLERLLVEEPFMTLVYLCGWFNIVMGVFNLLPVFPMDGGRILRALLGMRYPYMKATRIAVWTAKPLALIGIVVAIGAFDSPRWMLAALFAFIFIGGDLEYQHTRRVDELMRRHFRRLDPLSIPAEPSERDRH